jgi:2-polyprenyl-3-methyl-5-hydroxy-6-metoxy-1,4-benzoquinol methylase
LSLRNQYNEWHQRVYDASPEHADEKAPWYDLVQQYLGPLEGKRVLEVSCGRGGFSHLLAAKGAIMFGADFSEAALRIAQSRTAADGVNGKAVRLAQADAHNLPYADESFDVIISCETIEHLLDPLAAVKEMARVCRAGGLLYLTTPNYFNAMGLYFIYARLRGRRATPGADQPFDRVFLFPQVRHMLARAGWKVIRSDGTVHQFPIVPGHDPVAMRSVESNRTLRRVLSPLAFHYFLMAKREKAR